MTVKEFFKSTAFKCICVLLAILLVCGVFLTIMNSLLEVTDGERLQRAVKKIYSGIEVTIYGLDDDGNEIVIDSNVEEPKSFVNEKVTIGNALISDAYKITFTENGEEVIHYLVTSEGMGGYDNGTVTCGVAIEVANGKISRLYKVTIQDSKGQSFIKRINDEYKLQEFVDIYYDDIYYSQEMITGATIVKTKTAICNAVNGAIAYVNRNILNNVVVDKFEGFNNPQPTMINADRSDYTVENATVTYSLVTNGYGNATPFELTIVVDNSNGTPAIKSITVDKNGSVGSNGNGTYESQMMNVQNLVGKTIDYFTDLLGSEFAYGNPADIKTGATNSNYNVVYSCVFALLNYGNCIDADGGNS